MSQATAQREFLLNRSDLQFIIALVAQHTGIVLAEHKEDMIYSRIARRIRELKLDSFHDYCELLKDTNHPEELVHFINALTTNLTSFYRESHHFEHLEKQVIPAAIANTRSNTRIRLWSAACSSGAEAYSMAISCLEAIGNSHGLDIKILATDIDTKMIEKAKSGIYNETEISGLPLPLRKKYTSLDSVSGNFRMCDAVRKLITFKHMNLMHDWPFAGPFDAVFCRNVIIYFDKDTQRTLFERMQHYIKPEHWLYLGHSESLHNVNTQFTLRGKTIYQRSST